MKILLKRLNTNSSIPTYMTRGSSGLDLYSAEEKIIPPGKWEMIATGIAVEIPQGYEGQIRSRSGLAKDYGVFVLNSPGTIDSDYRGEVKVILMNLGSEPFRVNIGDRIAQLVIVPIVRAEILEVEELSVTERNNGGFGHTGRR
ncbi:MAG: dUTP diphosphatase [bacterium]|nr:dUTP diphosphatase [bacterium]